MTFPAGDEEEGPEEATLLAFGFTFIPPDLTEPETSEELLVVEEGFLLMVSLLPDRVALKVAWLPPASVPEELEGLFILPDAASTPPVLDVLEAVLSGRLEETPTEEGDDDSGPVIEEFELPSPDDPGVDLLLNLSMTAERDPCLFLAPNGQGCKPGNCCIP